MHILSWLEQLEATCVSLQFLAKARMAMLTCKGLRCFSLYHFNLSLTRPEQSEGKTARVVVGLHSSQVVVAMKLIKVIMIHVSTITKKTRGCESIMTYAVPTCLVYGN